MIGAVIGDIAGSRFEFNNFRSKNFTLITRECFPTDDSFMTIAIGKAILDCHENYVDLSNFAIKNMQMFGRRYPYGGYGGMFRHWLTDKNPQTYNSFGNGAAMRVSGAGFAARSLEEAKELARKVTMVTHNHPEGLKGAEAVAVAIYLARNNKSLEEIKAYINKNYYKTDFTLDEIRPRYTFNETCQGSVPQAFEAFFESDDFEDAIKNAVSIGGDSDTIAAITGGIAEAYYGVPLDWRLTAENLLDNEEYGYALAWLDKFEELYP